jgi:hypothetical protein
LEFAGQYAFCATHLAKRVADNAKKNAKNNGSDKHLASLRKHYATKKGRIPVDISVMAAIAKDLKHFRGLLEPIKDWLLSDKVFIYDTESDGVGATHELEKTREYHFFDVAKDKHLNIWARTKDKISTNTDYSHDSAQKMIMSFIQDAEVLIAYEPPNNDRNRLKELFGDTVYESKIAPKVICLKKAIINRIFTTNKAKDNIRIYLRGLTQPDVYGNLLNVGADSISSPTPDFFLPIVSSMGQPDDKCEKDVRQLANLFLYFRSIMLHSQQ